MESAVETGILCGVKVSRKAPPITHCLSADDLLFFVKASINNCESLNSILKTYCQCSAQVINLDKSSLIFSKNVQEDLKISISNIFNIPILDKPGKNLGLPSDWGKSKRQALKWIQDSICSKLSGRKEYMLSSDQICCSSFSSLRNVYFSVPVFALSRA